MLAADDDETYRENWARFFIFPKHRHKFSRAPASTDPDVEGSEIQYEFYVYKKWQDQYEADERWSGIVYCDEAVSSAWPLSGYAAACLVTLVWDLDFWH